MENAISINPNLATIPKSAHLIEKVHRCADCPIRQLAIKQPHSVFARLHIWHKTWWPGWKAYRSRVCAHAAGTDTKD
jgi:hypothetical protein